LYEKIINKQKNPPTHHIPVSKERKKKETTLIPGYQNQLNIHFSPQ
jgi:hypothetical protein